MKIALNEKFTKKKKLHTNGEWTSDSGYAKEGANVRDATFILQLPKKRELCNIS